MAVTHDSIRSRFPGVFPTGSTWDTALDLAIAEAQLRVSPDAFGDKTDTAITYLASHLAFQSTPARLAGAVKYQAGPVSMELGLGAHRTSGFLELYNDLIAGTVPGILVADADNF